MNWIHSHSKTKTESAYDSGIRVNWRAAIMSANGEPQIFGRLTCLNQLRAEVSISHGLLPGSHCHLVVMLPRKTGLESARQIIEGRCTVSASAPSAGQFKITLEWLEMMGDSEDILRDCLGKDVSVPMVS